MTKRECAKIMARIATIESRSYPGKEQFKAGYIRALKWVLEVCN